MFIRDEPFLGLIKGNDTPLQYSCLENPMDGGAWWAAVHGVARSRTRLSDFTFTFHIGEGNGNPLQCSCLENPRDRGAWWAAVSGVAQSQTRLKRLSSSSSSFHHKQIFLLLFLPCHKILIGREIILSSDFFWHCFVCLTSLNCHLIML